MSTEQQPAHIFILCHGLWGNQKHMGTIESAIKDMLPDSSKEKILTLSPSTYAYYKSYDGLEIIGSKVVSEILYWIKNLEKDENYKVVKFSIVGYSLGGLISRYVIGELYKIGFFESIEPIYFTTFATPHVGIQFYDKGLFPKIANTLGPYLFGYSGRELFIADKEKLLVTMSTPDSPYYKALKSFELRLALANIKNDRTVAFYTSFITDYSPFNQFNAIKVKYLKNLPQVTIGNALVRPKFVDLKRSQVLTPEQIQGFEGNKQENTSLIRRNKYLRYSLMIFLASFILPFWIPFVLTSTICGTIFSIVKIKFFRSYGYYQENSSERWLKLMDKDHPTETNYSQDDEENAFTGGTAQLMENTFEGFLNVEDRMIGHSELKTTDDNEDEEEDTYSSSSTSGVSGKSSRDNLLPDSDMPVPKTILETFTKNSRPLVKIDLKAYENSILEHWKMICLANEVEKYSTFKEKTRLPLNQERQFIVESLNDLGWLKLAIYIDAWNAHDGIVSRRGIRSNNKGSATVYLWCTILRLHLRNELPEEEK
ncbi:uncharacterized protein KQ657_001763 [Scheffersomyces spartinae]|uniref:DUF676 domain-containing protein n=1 Tax=Scheffersomyces spartinae TaxID=45513 RepID=A0A9P7V6V4_9ASCO|nr:uncharacterized protein KQ657_001763 [Scheffersomyces spartinae]KAG7192364.1 hypothetical protein KQ657_001763 [Scheffersomyces spartinae]